MFDTQQYTKLTGLLINVHIKTAYIYITYEYKTVFHTV